MKTSIINARNFILIICLVTFQGIMLGQNKNTSPVTKSVISGLVLDANNNPLPYVNVYIKDSFDGAMTDTSGKFVFKTAFKGKVRLIASLIGYKTFDKVYEIVELKNKHLTIYLNNKAVRTKEVVVTASSFGTEKGKGIVLSPLEVYMTPGGAADIFQTLKTLPGLTQVSESAELYVRGGSPDETLITVDQAPIEHPYTFESAYGGIFSSINTSAVKDMYFSSGGFSAKYGNTMSGVLELQTKDEPLANQLYLGLSLANLDITGTRQFINDKLGIRFNFRKSFTKPIFLLNGSSREFTLVPESNDFYGSLIYKFSRTGQLKFFTSGENDKEGVNVQLPGYIDQFNGKSGNNFYNLQYKDIPTTDMSIKSSLSFSRFTDNWKLGVLDFTQTDRVFDSRTDIDYYFTI